MFCKECAQTANLVLLVCVPLFTMSTEGAVQGKVFALTEMLDAPVAEKIICQASPW